MANMQLRRFKTISDFHQFRELPKPEHPLVSVINLELIKQSRYNEISLVKDFYSIALKLLQALCKIFSKSIFQTLINSARILLFCMILFWYITNIHLYYSTGNLR